MAVNVDTGGKEELKTQFVTREGIYRLITLSEYSRPNRVGYTNMQGSTSVRVSFVNLPDPSGNGDRICFNIGRELYVFIYKGVKKVILIFTVCIYIVQLTELCFCLKLPMTTKFSLSPILWLKTRSLS